MALIVQSLVIFLNIYFVLILIRVLLSWFPNVNWMSPPFSTVSQLTDPYLNLFRSIIPLGGIDFSPMLAIILLQFVSSALTSFAASSLAGASFGTF